MTKKSIPAEVFTGSSTGKVRKVHGTLFSLTGTRIQEKATALACVVSKKVASKAVDRNRIKRWCREAARQHARSLEVSYAMVFRAKKDAASATHADIEREIGTLVEKWKDTVYNASQ